MPSRWKNVAKYFGLSVASIAIIWCGTSINWAKETKEAAPADSAAAKAAKNDEDYELLSLFVDTLDQVERNYVKDISRRELVEAAIQGMLSKLDQQILRHVISRTKSYYCYRSFREGVPKHLREMVPDICALDFGRVRTINAPPLKVIRGYIEVNDPGLKVSNQKIADVLAMCGARVRFPRRRRTRRAAAI